MEELYRPIWVSIVGNLLLSVLKLVVGFLYSSIALISDGAHSLSDVVTSVIGYLGMRVSSKPLTKAIPSDTPALSPWWPFS